MIRSKSYLSTYCHLQVCLCRYPPSPPFCLSVSQIFSAGPSPIPSCAWFCSRPSPPRPGSTHHPSIFPIHICSLSNSSWTNIKLKNKQKKTPNIFKFLSLRLALLLPRETDNLIIELCLGKISWCQTTEKTARQFLVLHWGGFRLSRHGSFFLPPSLSSLSHLSSTDYVPGTALGFGAIKEKPSGYSYIYQRSESERCYDTDMHKRAPLGVQYWMGWAWRRGWKELVKLPSGGDNWADFKRWLGFSDMKKEGRHFRLKAQYKRR